MIIKLEKDGTIQIPHDMIDSLGWDINTTLDIELLEDGTIFMSEKTHWDFEDFRDNLEIILERMEVSKQKHYVTYEDRQYVLVPYEEYEKYQNLIDSIKEE